MVSKGIWLEKNLKTIIGPVLHLLLCTFQHQVGEQSAPNEKEGKPASQRSSMNVQFICAEEIIGSTACPVEICEQ
jgi:hypothetical protein